MLGSKAVLVVWDYFICGASFCDEVVDNCFVDFTYGWGEADGSIAGWVGWVFAFFKNGKNLCAFPLLGEVI